MEFRLTVEKVRAELLRGIARSTLNEVKRRFVDPVLTALGWQLDDMDVARLGVEVAGSVIDYALHVEGMMVVAVNVVPRGWVGDASRAPAAGACRILTDGRIWSVTMQNHVAQVDLLDRSADESVLAELRPEEFAEWVRAEAEREHVVDEAVSRRLWKLLSGSSEFAIAFRLGLEASESEIVAALTRCLGSRPADLEMGASLDSDVVGTVEIAESASDAVRPAKISEKVLRLMSDRDEIEFVNWPDTEDTGSVKVEVTQSPERDGIALAAVEVADLPSVAVEAPMSSSSRKEQTTARISSLLAEQAAKEFVGFKRYQIEAHPLYERDGLGKKSYREVLKDMAAAMIAQEAPFYVDDFIERIAKAHGSIAGVKCKQRCRHALDGQCVIEKELGVGVVWPKGVASKLIAKWRGAGGRTWEQVTTPELASLAAQRAPECDSKAELLHRMRDEFEGMRLTAKAKEKFERAVKRVGDALEMRTPHKHESLFDHGEAMEAKEKPARAPSPTSTEESDNPYYSMDDVSPYVLRILVRHPFGVDRAIGLREVAAEMGISSKVVDLAFAEPKASKFVAAINNAIYRMKKIGMAVHGPRGFWKATPKGLA